MGRSCEADAWTERGGTMNTEDRDLLELAAKAAGLELVTPTMLEHDKWNPLTDDGDAFRLMVKLYLTVYPRDPEDSFVGVQRFNGSAQVLEAFQGLDSMDATRRAIVLAAAKIGRGMA